MFLVNSRLGLLSAAPPLERPLSRSYRTILPSSLTMNLSCALVFSTRSRVSVYSTGAADICLADFLGGQIGCIIRAAGALRYYRRSPRGAYFTTPLSGYGLQPAIPSAGSSYFSASLRRYPRQYRNINLSSIWIALRLPLGPDLPPGDWHCRGILDLSACGVPARIIVTYAYICFSARSTMPRGTASKLAQCSPTDAYQTSHGFGCMLMPAYYPCRNARLVSCYALFK